jgi:hypothetical protein
MKNLPIGLSGLAKMLNNNCVYIDKTHHIANLAKLDGYYFLSRPRRFGKSLLIDSLKEAFSGNKELFTGLYLENNWNWSVSYPIIHFDFGGSSALDSEQVLLDIIWSKLRKIATIYQVKLQENYQIGQVLENLIWDLYDKYQQKVVLLIDEYDKPILDCITDAQQAVKMREILKKLYSVIKANDTYLKFVFITGVSKFSKVSLFSGLNNLNDISLDAKYADICGYTQSELETHFAEYLTDGNVDRTELKKWYNGYNFAGIETKKVYNPFDILLFFEKDYQYRNYWFETATPTFLIELIKQNHYFIPEFENIIVPNSLINNFEVEDIEIITLLFQSGYLTIKQLIDDIDGVNYQLTYPNFEVKLSLNQYLANLGNSKNNYLKQKPKLRNCLVNNQFTELNEILTSHFASIPHDWYRNNNIANYEGFYASVVYSYFTALGYDLVAEDATNYGRIDLSIAMPDKIILLEFKLTSNGDALSAIAQIKAKNYAQKYIDVGKPIYAIGMSFDPVNRNVVDLVSEQLN